ncbi:MAG: hypothetical protein GX600_01655 [Dehalococcoidia bacterium]|nr:hypothetical protein [Dehalococcoidia bacterium]
MDKSAVRTLILYWKAQGLSQEEIGERVAGMDLNGYREDACEYVHEAFASDLFPEIVVTNRPMRDVSHHALEVLYGCNGDTDGIYRRAGTLVRIVQDDEGRPIIEPLSESAFRGRLERKCAFFVTGKGGKPAPIPPPMDVVRDCMSLGEWQFPALMGITETPVLRADGTVFATPGYDTKTRLYYPPGSLTVDTVPDEPSDLDIGAAINLLHEPICDFPFDCPASKANALAAMMTPVVRPMIDSPVPLTIIDKPQAGTGASLMAEVISIIATGRSAAMMTAQNDDDSWRKAIVSLLWRGQQVAVIDNIEHTLWAPSLASVLTANTFQDRVLGRTEMIQLPNRVTWIGTGNNIKLAGDLPRRTVWVRLDAKQARPWLRDAKEFRHPNLIEWVTQHRAELIRATLIIARAWVVAGKPQADESPALGGYESWCRVIGGILHFIEVPGFLANLEELYAQADTETPQWEAFLEAWHSNLGDEPTTVSSLISYLTDNADFSSCLPDAIGDRAEKGFSRKLGKALAKRESVRFPNGLVLVKGIEPHKKVATWAVRGFDGSETPNPAGFERNAGFAGFDSTQAHVREMDLFSPRVGGEINPADPANPAESDADFIIEFPDEEEGG